MSRDEMKPAFQCPNCFEPNLHKADAVNVILPKDGLPWLVVTIPADIIAFGGLLWGIATLFKGKDKKPLSLKETQELLGSEEPIDVGPIPLDPISAKALADEIMRRLEK